MLVDLSAQQKAMKKKEAKSATKKKPSTKDEEEVRIIGRALNPKLKAPTEVH